MNARREMTSWYSILCLLTVVSALPFPASAADCKMVSVAAGDFFSLAANSGGICFGWGQNSSGQLARSDWPSIPVELRGLPVLAGIGAGGYHSLFIAADDTPWAVGRGREGQLGNGTNQTSPVPSAVIGMAGLTVDGGRNHSVALDPAGRVWCWGQDNLGQLGDGSYIDSNVPVTIPSLAGMIDVDGGFAYTLAARSDGTVWAWGDDSAAQLGDGTFNTTNVPVQTVGLGMVSAVAAGWYHSLALRQDGFVFAWGSNLDGELGDGTTLGSTRPIRTSNLTNVVAIAAGDMHSLALRDDGTVWAWGNNSGGQLGDGTNSRSLVPIQVLALSDVSAIAANRGHNVALRRDGTVWAWGDGVTLPTRVDFDTPVGPEGNVLLAARQGRDVWLEFPQATDSSYWRVYADPDKGSIGLTALAPDSADRTFLDSGALDRTGHSYYYLRRLSLCSNTPGP